MDGLNILRDLFASPDGTAGAASPLADDPNPSAPSADPVATGGLAGQPTIGPDPTAALKQAKVLAQLYPKAGRGGTGIMDGLTGSKLPDVAGKSRFGAFAAGLDAGLSGHSAAKTAAAKSSAQDIKDRMEMLKKLFDMDRTLKKDTSDAAHQKVSETNETTRANAYKKSVEQPSKVEAKKRDALLDESRITGILAKHPAQAALDADDEADGIVTKKLAPEQRLALQAKVDAERARLQGLTKGEQAAATGASDDDPEVEVPGFKGTWSRKKANGTEADDSPDEDDVAKAQAAAKTAQAALTPSGSAATPPAPGSAAQAAPGELSPDELQNQVSEADAAPQRNPARPEDTLAQAREAITRGADPQKVKARLAALGIDTENLDF